MNFSEIPLQEQRFWCDGSQHVKLGIATAMAVEQQKFNGEMKDARESADKAQKAYWEFINNTAADEITKVGH